MIAQNAFNGVFIGVRLVKSYVMFDTLFAHLLICVPPETVCLSRNVVIYSSSLSPQLYPVADGAKYSKLLNDLSSSEVGHLPGTQFGKTGSLGTSHRHKMLTAIEKLYLSGGNDFERNPRWSLLAFPGPVIFKDEVCVCVGGGGGGEGGLD